MRTNKVVPYLFLLPALAILALGLMVPLYNAVLLSFYDWNFGQPWSAARPLGFANFERLWNDPVVWRSVRTTFVFGFWVVTLEMLIGVSMALLLEKAVRGATFFRTIFVMPLMIAPVVVGLIWRYLLDARNGIVNFYLLQIGEAVPVLQNFGFKAHTWLGDPTLAMVSIIVSDVWQWTPFVFMIVLAGLQGLPGDVMEAAYIDGASWWRMTWHIKLPMLRNILLIALLMRVIDVFRALEVIFVMTGGGPGSSTRVLSLTLFQTAFTSRDLGYASTIALLLSVILIVFSLVLLLFSNPLKDKADF
ncbi:MAG: sugar ABC transporter permease [Trueperaceae bacterium]|nr:MAG: sugar ABC transporter permease [Trueperaceae bacterium]